MVASVPATATPLVAALGWTILLAPLAATAVIVLLGIHRRRLAAAVAVGSVLLAFLATGGLLLQALGGQLLLPARSSVSWIALPGVTISVGVWIDRLSLLMSLVVTGVGSAIFLYATGYMAGDHAYGRFFGTLSLFAFSMLLIVLADNWIQLFMGWELVGCSSYLLIGHWYAKPAAAEAGKKAFMVNRVADFAFLLGILALWTVSSPVPAERIFDFHALQERLPELTGRGVIPASLLPLIGLLIFCGPIGKSAQFPLHVWLPDAMEGPTPVSALIHAATMVAAGVYLLCRTFWLFEGTPLVLATIMWVGGLTALFSAALALVEDDLKRILAYSTLSQLGYMVMALGLGGPVAAMYHLTMHAFFKALLFLAAGSVIHATHEQVIWRLGGLRRSMPWTALSFLIGGLALCGMPGFSGFFSKEAILTLAHDHHPVMYGLGLLIAGLTAFYIARAWFVAFTGAAHGHNHESPAVMIGPLLLLTLLSVIGGYLGIPQFLGGHRHAGGAAQIVWMSCGMVGLGLVTAWLMYHRKAVSAQQLVHALALPYSFLQRRYYIDELYDWYVTRIQQKVIAGLCAWLERYVVIGAAVNGTAWITQTAGRLLRRLQTGAVQTYVLWFLIGVTWLLAVPLRR